MHLCSWCNNFTFLNQQLVDLRLGWPFIILTSIERLAEKMSSQCHVPESLFWQHFWQTSVTEIFKKNGTKLPWFWLIMVHCIHDIAHSSPEITKETCLQSSNSSGPDSQRFEAFPSLHFGASVVNSHFHAPCIACFLEGYRKRENSWGKSLSMKRPPRTILKLPFSELFFLLRDWLYLSGLLNDVKPTTAKISKNLQIWAFSSICALAGCLDGLMKTSVRTTRHSLPSLNGYIYCKFIHFGCWFWMSNVLFGTKLSFQVARIVRAWVCCWGNDGALK